MVLADITPRTIQVIRSHLISSKEGLSTHEINSHYKEFFGHQLGRENEVEEWLLTRSDLCRPKMNSYGAKIWGAVLTEETAHVQKMVQKQKTKPKKKPKELVRPMHLNHVSSSRRVITRSQAKSKPLLENPKRSNLDYNRNMLFPDPYRKERIREKEYRSEVSDTNYDVNRSVGSSLNSSGSRSPEHEPMNTNWTQAKKYKEHDEWSREVEKRTETFPQRTEILYKQYGDKEGSSGSSIIPKTKRRIEVKTKVNQKQATTDGMRKFLIDQITKSGGVIEFGELLQFFNLEFMVTRLKKRPISSEKFGEIMKRFPEMSTKETAEGTIMCMETENKKEDSFQKQVLDRLCNLEMSVNNGNERQEANSKVISELKKEIRILTKLILQGSKQ